MRFSRLSILRSSNAGSRSIHSGAASVENSPLASRRGRHRIRIVLALLLTASMWYYVRAILVPYQQADAAHYGRPRGNLSDLYPRWMGARELLLHGRNPYGQEVTREIQMGYYGRRLDPSRPYDPKDQQAFAYPVYVTFLLAPIIKQDFSDVQTAFGWLLIALTIASIPLWLFVLRWRILRSSTLVLVLLTLGCWGVVQGFALQQLSLLVAVMLAGTLALVVAGHLAPAGVLLALATIKPQLSVPLAIWLGLWSFGHFRRRWPLLVAFLVSMLVLIGGGELILPGWIAKFWSAVREYRAYTGGVSGLDKLLGPVAALIMTVALVVFVGWACWKLRRSPAPSSGFAIGTSMVLAATVLMIPTFAPYNQVLLVPAVMAILQYWRYLIRTGRAARLVFLVTAVAVFWPWLATLALGLTSLFVPTAKLEFYWALPLYTSLFIPLGITALLIFLLVAELQGRLGADRHHLAQSLSNV